MRKTAEPALALAPVTRVAQRLESWREPLFDQPGVEHAARAGAPEQLDAVRIPVPVDVVDGQVLR
jgi:hypothetical protein